MQIRPNVSALFVLFLASSTSLHSVAAQNGASGVSTPCPTLPQPPLTQTPPHSPCPTLSQPSLPATSNSNNNHVAAESDPAFSVTALSPVITPAPATTAPPAALAQAAAAVVMPPVVSCTPVSVKGDATYCISGRVCSGADSSLPGTNCPKKGDVAIAHCWNTLKSYNGAGDNCIAPQDAQCVVIETGVWGCAFPSTTAAAPVAPLVPPVTEVARSEVAADADAGPPTPMPVEIASVQPATVRVDSATTRGIVTANYASANYAFATNLENEQPSASSTAGGTAAGVNVLVAVGALVVAVVGIAIAKKRQHDRLDTQNNSIRNLGCVELSTPI